MIFSPLPALGNQQLQEATDVVNQAMIPLSVIFSYPLFADADMGIYPNTASVYHAQLKANKKNQLIHFLTSASLPFSRPISKWNYGQQ